MGEFFWEILKGIMGKILSIIGSSLLLCMNPVATESVGEKPEGSHNAHSNNQLLTEK